MSDFVIFRIGSAAQLVIVSVDTGQLLATAS